MNNLNRYQIIGTFVLGFFVLAGTACAQQDRDAQGSNNSAPNIWGTTPSASGASSTYQMTPEQRAALKTNMKQAATQIGQVARDFREFYSELQSAVEESGLVEEVNRMSWSGANQASSSGFGAADVSVIGDEMIVTVDLPGVSKGDLSVSLADKNELRVKVARGEIAQGSNLKVSERYSGDLNKSISLPHEAKGKNFTASLENGVLKVVIPREPSNVDEVQIPIT